jgi:hypothetical protein
MSRRAVPALIVVAFLGAGCGAREVVEPTQGRGPGGSESARQLGPRYGITVSLPAGWDGRLRRGALYAANFQLPTDASDWLTSAAEGLGPDDILVALFENEPPKHEPDERDGYRELDGPLRLESGDFLTFDGITEESRATGHGYARRSFQTSGRLFVLFAESGRQIPGTEAQAGLNDLLASLAVAAGDFFPGAVEAPRFSDRAGWFVGASGPDDARAEGEFTTAWAATVPYADAWNALPPIETLSLLPADGVIIWVGLSRSNRNPPRPEGTPGFPAREPPFSLDDFDHRAGWEGQFGDLPEYVFWATVRGQYHLDLRVYFGRPDPSERMLAEAQEMLEGLELPVWGSWEVA